MARAACTLLLGVLVVAAAGCGRAAKGPGGAGASGDGASGDGGADTFRILAGSELRDLAPAIQAAAAQAHVNVAFSYAGTLDIVERINDGEHFDAILPPNGAYPVLALAKKPLAREKLFYSRVALGVKATKAAELGWDANPPTWAEIAAAARAGRFRYAMTNPTSSNTGMSALFAVASAAAKKTEDLAVQDVDPHVITDFLAGQKLTAGSSGWLADAYLKDPSVVDGIVNYEAVILRLNDKLPQSERLNLIYPRDGVISADYPLMLLESGRRDEYNRLVVALKGTEFQRSALGPAYLRPSNPDAGLVPALPSGAVAELAFPNRLEVIDAVLTSYQSNWRRPSTSIFVLDVSGSMAGERLDGVRKALRVLAGADTSSATARYARFQNRERVVLITFSNDVSEPTTVDVAAGDIPQAHARIRDFADALRAKNGTAIYSALSAANDLALREAAADTGRFVSIVLLTDGESNTGISFGDYASAVSASPQHVRVFPILFGESSVDQMQAVADLTGGRVFDARTTSLAVVFKEIRGYQ
ncbi:MAG: VWA domain-containing protein [Bacteroidetes bacterium]|nr:VWA domain-containing protein [Bacteroidota bacterium]